MIAIFDLELSLWASSLGERGATANLVHVPTWARLMTSSNIITDYLEGHKLICDGIGCRREVEVIR